MIWLFAALIAVVGVFTPDALRFLTQKNIDFPYNIVIGLLFCLVGWVLELLYVCKHIEKKNAKTFELVDKNSIMIHSHNKFHEYIIDIYNDFEKIDKTRYDLFIDIFMCDAKNLSEKISQACTECRFKGRVQYVVDEKQLLSYFSGNNKATWKMTWFLGAGEPFYGDAAWESYFNKGFELLKQQKIGQIDIVFINEGGTAFQTNEYEKFKKDTAKVTSIHYRTISKKLFIDLLKDSGMKDCHYEFGIYDDDFIFSYDAFEARNALYTKNPDDIKNYTSFFDTIWRSASTPEKLPQRNPSMQKK